LPPISQKVLKHLDLVAKFYIINFVKPKVGIVVVNYNGREDTLKCLDSLVKITYPNYKIYLVDNGSQQDISMEVNQKFPSVKFIKNAQNLGYTGGNNTGIKVALNEGSQYIFVLNNDTVVAPDFLDKLVDGIGDAGMASPKIYFMEQEKVIWAHGAKVCRWTARSAHIGVYQKDKGQYDNIIDVERITGCAMLIKREVLEKIGLLDDRFFIYEEELDLCLRAVKAGYKLRMVPDSIIWHKGHRDAGRLGRPFIKYLQTRNHLLLLRKNSWYFHLSGTIAIVYAFLCAVKEILLNGLYFIISDNIQYIKLLRAVLIGYYDYFRQKFGRPEETIYK
jgi:hypothetical protein